MKVYIWQRVGECSDNRHSSGGVVVFAETEGRAREAANELEHCKIRPGEAIDVVREVRGGEEAVYIFPDAGCC